MRNFKILMMVLLTCIGFIFEYSYALTDSLGTKALTAQMRGVGEESPDVTKEHVILTNIADLISSYQGAADSERPGIAQEIERSVVQLNELYGARYQNQVLLDQSRVSEGLIELQLSVVDPKVPGSQVRVLYVIEGPRVISVISGNESVQAYISRTKGPGQAGSAFGEHDPATLDHVRAMLPQAKPMSESIDPAQRDAIRQALEGLPKTLTLPIDQLPLPLRTLNTLTDVDRILNEALVVDDPEDRFLVAFIDDKPVFERNFLNSILNNPPEVAHLLMHEDLEPRIDTLLKENGVSGIHPHDVVTTVQTDMIGPSIVGRVNRLYDLALLYRLALHRQGRLALSPQDLADANVVEAYETLPSNLRDEIRSLALQGAGQDVGIALELGPEGKMMLGGVALTEDLSRAIQASRLDGKVFFEGVDMTFQGIARFLVRAVVLNRVYQDQKSQENILAKHQLVNVTNTPKAAIIDVDALVSVDYSKLLNPDGSVNMEAGEVDLSQIAVGISKALSEKVSQVQAQGGDLKFFLVSKKLPQALLDRVIQLMDTGMKNLPVAVAYKNIDDLMGQVSSQFKGRTLTEDDVLFYIKKENMAAYRQDTAFAKFYKVIEVQSAREGERVSVAKLMIGLQWLYLPQEEAKKVDQVLALFRDILTNLYQTGEISKEEYESLLPVKDADTSVLMIPPVKSDSMTRQIEDSLRTTVAAAKFA